MRDVTLETHLRLLTLQVESWKKLHDFITYALDKAKPIISGDHERQFTDIRGILLQESEHIFTELGLIAELSGKAMNVLQRVVSLARRARTLERRRPPPRGGLEFCLHQDRAHAGAVESASQGAAWTQHPGPYSRATVWRQEGGALAAGLQNLRLSKPFRPTHLFRAPRKLLRNASAHGRVGKRIPYTMSKLTKRDIVVSISNQTGMVQHQVFEVVQRTLDQITDSLARNVAVELRNFGVFQPRLTKPRVGRNPNQPGSSFVIPPRATVKFKAGKIMRQRVEKLSREMKEAAERQANGAPQASSDGAAAGNADHS